MCFYSSQIKKMMIFTPQNDSDVCNGITNYEASRIPSSELYIQVNFSIFILSILIWTISLIWCWFNRHELRMRSVRPFSVNVVLIVSNILVSVALSLNLSITSLPCGLLLGSLLLGMGGCSAHAYITLVIFVIESHFATNVKRYTVLSDDESSDAFTKSDLGSGFAFYSLLKIAIGYDAFDELSFEALVKLKKAYWVIALFVLLPIAIPVLIILLTIPVYRHCTNCAIFLEPFVVFILVYVVYIVAFGRILWIAHQSKFVDTQGVYFQLGFISIPAGPFALASLILAILDPGNASFNHQYMYFEWTWQFLLHVFYWGGTIGLNIKSVYSSKKNSVVHDTNRRITLYSSISSAGILTELERNKSLRDQFEAYAIQHYSAENLYFMEDVKVFKRIFYNKDDMWRLKKVRDMIAVYIKTGSVMEMNISHSERQDILERFTTMSHSADMYTIFDNAVSDIGVSVLNGLYSQFEESLRRQVVSLVTVGPLDM